MSKITIPQTPKEILQKKLTTLEQVTRQKQAVFFVDDSVFPGGLELPESGGVFVHKQGGRVIMDRGQPKLVDQIKCLYPEKGYPDPNAVGANNIAKRVLMGYVSFFANPAVIMGMFGILFLPFSKNVNIIRRFVDNCHNMMRTLQDPYYLEEIRYSNPCREIRKMAKEFLLALGIKSSFPKDIAHLIEYDTAYRYRIEDILSETTKEKLLKNPRKEIKRLAEIFKQREPKGHLFQKFNYFSSLARLALLHPKIKRAFKKALEVVDFKQMQLDEADRYHVLKYSGYDFLGLDAQTRAKMYVEMHHGNPPQMIEISS
jgi:hypothetical protein